MRNLDFDQLSRDMPLSLHPRGIRFFDPQALVANCDVLHAQIREDGQFVRIEVEGRAPAGTPVWFSQNYYRGDPEEATDLRTHRGALGL